MQEADQREVSVGYCAQRNSPSFFLNPGRRKGGRNKRELSFGRCAGLDCHRFLLTTSLSSLLPPPDTFLRVCLSLCFPFRTLYTLQSIASDSQMEARH